MKNTIKLSVKTSPPELIERVKTYYFSRKEVSKLTGLNCKQLQNLSYRKIVCCEYYLPSYGGYYSYANILELMLVKKIWEHKKQATAIIHARKVLRQIGKNIDCLAHKQILMSSGELYLVERIKMSTFIINLSKKYGGQLNLQIFDIGEIEFELEKNSIKNNIVNFKQRKIIAYMGI